MAKNFAIKNPFANSNAPPPFKPILFQGKQNNMDENIIQRNTTEQERAKFPVEKVVEEFKPIAQMGMMISSQYFN